MKLRPMTDVEGRAAEAITFEDRGPLTHTSFIDGCIPGPHVPIEQR